ncbi:MAG: recombinase family protein [Synergistaceae bacterium]|nr:recombinase family protein [Synergistaceae bacterium]
MGYDVDKETRKYIVNEKEAETVRYIFLQYAEGVGYNTIIAHLNDMGWHSKRGKIFGKNSLHDLLKNPKCMGIYKMIIGMICIEKLKLYLETTMFNYYFDTDRDGHADTVTLFEAIREGKYEAYTSGYTVLELEDAPEPKRGKMLVLMEEYPITMLGISDEADRLAEVYIAEKIIPSRYRDDSAHIAVASIHGLHCVLSYNFKHINRLNTKIQTGRVNRAEGYNGVMICTAKEVLDNERRPD